MAGFTSKTLGYGFRITIDSLSCVMQQNGLTCINQDGGRMHLNQAFHALK